MRTSASVVFGVTGQTLSVRVPQGQPTSATVDIYRNYSDDTGTPEFSATGTIDPVATTVSVLSGGSQSDPQRISLASTTGIIIGREYQLGEAGLLERVIPVEIRTGYIRIRYPLLNDYTTAATFLSGLVTAPVLDTWAALVGKLSDLTDQSPDYRARWSVTVAGVVVIAYSFFDLVRSEIRQSVTMDDINARAPGLRDSLPIEYRAEVGRPLIDTAWRTVRADFAAIGIDPNAVRDDEVVDELVILRALRILGEGGWRPGGLDIAPYLELVTANYDRFFERHFAVTLKHRLQQQVGADFARGSDLRRASGFWRK